MNIGNHYSSWIKNSQQAGCQNYPAKSGGTNKNDTGVADGSKTGKEQAGAENGAPKTYREQILEHMEEMAKKVKDGTVEPTFQTGAQSFTIKEWEKLLADFDDAEEALQEQIKELIAEVEKQAQKESLRRQIEAGTAEPGEVTDVSVPGAAQPEAEAAGSVANPKTEAAGGAANPKTEAAGGAANPKTEAVGGVDHPGAVKGENVAGAEDSEKNAALLTDEVTKCSYPTDDPKQKHWYITCYGQDGIMCKEAYFDGSKWVNKDCWSLSYTEEGQYEKVMAFLQRFPQDANLRFAAHENFWKDFLAGEIDEDDFVNFFETSTRDGVPDYTYEEDGSTYIDREKIKYAKYMNDFGVKLYTAEEMELIQRAVIRENRKGLKKISDYGGQMTVPGGGKGGAAGDEEDDLKTQIITKPDGSSVLQIETSFGVMEIEITQAQKFGLAVDAGRDGGLANRLQDGALGADALAR